MTFRQKNILFWGLLSVLGSGIARPSRADSLADRLMSPAPDVRTQALRDLDAAGNDQKKVVLISLIEALRKDSDSAGWAAQALTRFGPSAKEAIPDLVEALRYDDTTTYASVSAALLKMGTPALPFLESALNDPNFFVRQRAAEILGAFGPDAKKASRTLVGLLSDSQYQVHDAAEAALVKIGDAALPALQDDLKTVNQDMARTILTTLGKFGPSATPILLETLRKNEDASVRAAAAEILGTIHPATNETVLQMTADLKDLDEWVRVAIVEALGNLGPDAKAAIGTLIFRFYNDQDPLVKDKAREALKKIGPATADSLPGLLRAYKDENVDVRRDVIMALDGVTLPSKDVMPLLIQASKDPDPALQQKARQLLTNLTPPSVSTPTANKN